MRRTHIDATGDVDISEMTWILEELDARTLTWRPIENVTVTYNYADDVAAIEALEEYLEQKQARLTEDQVAAGWQIRLRNSLDDKDTLT